MKDDLKGQIINEFSGLKFKMHSLINVDDEEVTKAKRVNKKNVKNLLMFCLIKRVQSKFHRIGTYDVCKTSLSCFDDKRYILDDGVNSLAYFYKGTKN